MAVSLVMVFSFDDGSGSGHGVDGSGGCVVGVSDFPGGVGDGGFGVLVVLVM